MKVWALLSFYPDEGYGKPYGVYSSLEKAEHAKQKVASSGLKTAFPETFEIQEYEIDAEPAYVD